METAPSRGSSEAIPSVIGEFQVLRQLGTGGQGEVFLARDPLLGRLVAIKRPRLDAQALLPGALERFLDEARAVARLDHPNIVRVHFAGVADGLPFMTFEFVEGQDLRERLSDGALGLREALRIALGIAEGLAESHAQGILHRDIKPDNVLIGRDGRPRILDFGIAKRLAPLAEEPLAEGPAERGAGTRSYFAPEQWLGEDESPAADVWSLGVTLFEMLTGRRPFEGASSLELAMAVLSPEPAPELPPTIATLPRLQALVASMLAKKPDARPSVRAVLEALSTILEDTRRSLDPEIVTPFPGLLPYDAARASLFFGRDAEIDRFIEDLRQRPRIAIAGPSGAGKSSFVRAGLIPRLDDSRHWLVLALRPGLSPFEALARSCLEAESSRELAPSGTPVTGAELGGTLLRDPSALGRRLRALAARASARILLFVDQLEEIETLVEHPEIRRGFLTALHLAADDPQGPIRLVTTIRDDILGSVAGDEAARALLDHITLMRAPGPAELRVIIERPFTLRGFTFDDPDLVGEIVTAVERETAALPLLAFTGLALWERRDRIRRTIRRADYDALGGVAGALAQHADGVIATLGDGDIEVVRVLLLRLVTSERTRRIVKLSNLLEGLPESASRIVDRLVDARLLISRGATPSNDSEIELSHEALISRWTRLRRWIEETSTELAALEEVTLAAELWSRRGEPARELWPLEAALQMELRLKRSGSLPRPVARFLGAAKARGRRTRLLRRLSLLGAFLVLSTASMVLFIQRESAIDAQLEAERQRAHTERENAISALASGEIHVARERLLNAETLVDTLAGRALEYQIQRQSPRIRLWSSSPANTVWSSADGRTLFTNDQSGGWQEIDVDSGKVTLFPVKWGGPKEQPVVIRPVDRIAGQQDAYMLIGTWEGQIVLVSRGGEVLAHAGGHEGSVWRLALDPGGRRLATSGFDGRIRTFRLPDLHPLRSLATPAPRIYGLEFSPSGAHLAFGGHDGKVRVAEAETLNTLMELELGGNISAIKFSEGDKNLIVGTSAGGLFVIDWREKKILSKSFAQDARIWDLATDPSTRLAASTGGDGRVFFWQLPSLAVLGVLTPPKAALSIDLQVNSVSFSGNGQSVGIGRQSGMVEVWSVQAALEAGAPAAVELGEWSQRDADDTLTVSLVDGTLARIDPETGAITARLPGGGERGPAALAFSTSQSRARYAVLTSKNLLRVFDADSGQLEGERAMPFMINLMFPAPADLLVASSLSAVSVLSPVDLHEIWGTKFRSDMIGRIRSGTHRDLLIRLDSGETDRRAAETGRQLTRDSRERGRSKRRNESFWLPNGRTLFADFSYGPISSGSSTTAEVTQVAETGEVCEGELDGQRAVVHPGGLTLVGGRDKSIDRLISADLGVPRSCSWTQASQGRIHIEGNPWPQVIETVPPRTIFRAPIFLERSEGGFASFSARGWQAVTPDSSGAYAAWSPLPPSVRRAVETEALAADVDPSKASLCLLDHQANVELWNLARDERIFRAAAPDARAVFATRDECLILTDQGVRRRTAAGKDAWVAGGRGVLVEEGQAIIATAGGLLLDSRPLSLAPPSNVHTDATDPRLIVRVADGFAVVDGQSDLHLFDERGRCQHEATLGPRSVITQLAAGPRGGVFVGTWTGRIHLFDPESGDFVLELHVLGAVEHLAYRDGFLYVSTQLGELRAFDLRALSVDECQFVRRLWRTVPVRSVRNGGTPAPPPSTHRCFQERSSEATEAP